jgi:hypothetical protein
MGFIDFFILPLYFLIGHSIINVTVNRNKLGQQKPLLVKLFYYHTAFALIYATYVQVFGGDSLGYWGMTRLYQFMRNGSLLELHEPGTPFVYLLAYPFSKWLGLSFWTETLIFSLFGFGGIIFLFLLFFRTLRIAPKLFGLSLFPLVLFLPNMHFWSSGIGKDSVMFFALALFIYALTNPLRFWWCIVLALYLAFFCRPHFALLMVVGFGFSMLTSLRGLAIGWRLLLFAVSISLFMVMSPAVFEFIRLDSTEVEQLEDLANVRSKNLSRSSVGSSIDISSYSVPVKILTFLFRPLFFDAPNLFGVLVSFENLFYVLLAGVLLRPGGFAGLFTLPTHLKAALFVVLSAAFFMSSSLSNLGIIIRQKNMVMFMFVLITMYLLSEIQRKQLTKRNPGSPRRRPLTAPASASVDESKNGS